MVWFKRNLGFSITLLLLLGAFLYGCYYLFSKVSSNTQAQTQLEETDAKLKKIYDAKVFPSQTNILLLKAQESELKAFGTDAAKAKTPVPFDAKMSSANFKTLLDTTLADLSKQAEQARVTVVQKDFSFAAIKPLVNFVEGSVPVLAEQLADLRTIISVLLKSDVSSIDSIKREAGTRDDVGSSALGGPDYHTYPRRTNEVTGDISMFYSVSFRGFTEALSSVINNLQTSPHGLTVKLLSLQPDRSVGFGVGGGPPPPLSGAPGAIPAGQPLPPPLRGAPPPGAARPPGVAPPPVARRLDVIADERPFKVALLIEVTKPAVAPESPDAKPQ